MDLRTSVAKHLALLIPLYVAISGCAEMEAREEAKRREMAERYMAGIRTACEQYGFEQGTTEFSQCMMQLDQAQRERAAAVAGALLSQPKKSATTFHYPNLPQRTETNCQTDNYGNTRCVTK